MKHIFWLVTILILLLCLAGCISPSSTQGSSQIQTPTPEIRYVTVTILVTPSPTAIYTPYSSSTVITSSSPKYSIGDIHGQARGESTGWIVLDYTPETDRYTTQIVHFANGQWVYYSWSPGSYDRVYEENYDPIYLGHVDPKSLKKG